MCICDEYEERPLQSMALASPPGARTNAHAWYNTSTLHFPTCQLLDARLYRSQQTLRAAQFGLEKKMHAIG